jgi:hypothetical protein
VNRRRVAFATTSISGPLGARSAALIDIRSLLALDTKLQGGHCLTDIGREGQLKEEMYQKSSTCGLCGQHIADLDDAALDHNKMYWLGGETVPENARLAHRFCNWARPRGQAGGDLGAGSR